MAEKLSAKEQELARIQDILLKNSRMNFVKRIISPDVYPRLDLGGGNYATHKMSYSEIDGKHIVYPTVVFDEKSKGLIQLKANDAVNHALDKGEYIPFDTPEDADWFSKNYKNVWK